MSVAGGPEGFSGGVFRLVGMPVRVVSSPFHRLRCVSCSQRVSDLRGPFFDFGSLEDGDVELLTTDPHGKKQHHDDVLVCAGCLQKAAARLPGAAEVDADHKRALVEAIGERDSALRLAASLSSETAVRVNEALASSALDPRGQSNMTLPSPETQAPPQLSSVNGEVPVATPPDIAVDVDDLDGLTVKQLRGLAKERDIQVPAAVTSRADLVEHLSDQLTAPELG